MLNLSFYQSNGHAQEKFYLASRFECHEKGRCSIWKSRFQGKIWHYLWVSNAQIISKKKIEQAPEVFQNLLGIVDWNLQSCLVKHSIPIGI